MTEAEMRGLIERADAVKGDRARERIEAARSQARKQAGVPAEKPEAGEHRRRRSETWRSGAGSSTQTVAEPGACVDVGSFFP